MNMQDLTVETMHAMQRLILQWAQVNVSGIPGEELPGQIFDALDTAGQLNTRLMEMNGWTASTVESAAVIPASNVLSRRAARIFRYVLTLPEEEWPELLIEAVASAYGKGWESRIIQIGDRYITFASDVKLGAVVFKTDLYRAFHIFTQFCELSDGEIRKLRYRTPYVIFDDVEFRQRRHSIFQRFQLWGVIPQDEEFEG